MEALGLSAPLDLLTNDLLCCTVLLISCVMSKALISCVCVSDDEDD